MADSTKIYLSKLANYPKNKSIPQYATSLSAGMDVMAAIDVPTILQSGDMTLIPTGISTALPEGHELQIRARSGLAAKHGLTVLNAPGTIDADYRGEIKVVLINLGKEAFTIEPAMRIAQIVIAKYTRVEWELVDSLDETERGSGSFGSTGV